MESTQPLRIKSINEYHRIMGLHKPEHPLISVINRDSMKHLASSERPTSMIFDFYSIALKRSIPGSVKFKYGQQQYDFDEGTMFFMAPGQVFGVQAREGESPKQTGWMLFIHPDFLWNTALAKNIKKYEYFDYAVHEALFVSAKEEKTIISIMQSMEQEYHSNIDKFSQSVIIAQIELLLTYSERFYHRQFLTRKIANQDVGPIGRPAGSKFQW